MVIRFLAALIIAVAAGTADAQSSSDQVVAGDKDYVELNAPSALAHYEKALAADPRNFEALWKASRSAVDIGSYAADESRQTALFSLGEQFARRALALNPNDPQGHFALARALGKTALAQSPRGRVKYATEIRLHALDCLKLDPRNGGCLHVMGMWNAEVMRLNGFTRMVAKNFLGGKVFGSASWAEALSYMQKSVDSDPGRIIHHLDLAGVYRDMKDPAHERQELETVLRLPQTDVNDRHYKDEARAELAAIR